MKLRPMTWGRGVELLFGVFLPCFAIKIIPVGLMAVRWFFSWCFSGFSSELLPYDTSDAGILLFVHLPIVAALFFLLVLILVGPQEINRWPVLRWLYLLIGLVGTVLSGFSIAQGVLYIFSEMMSGRGYYIPWVPVFGFGVVSGGTCVVWLRYLPVLLRGKTD